MAARVTSALPPYLRPDRLDEALAILASEPRLVVAGGTDVYPAYATRPIDRPVLDITALPGLRGVADDGDAWRIPALTTWTDLAETAAARPSSTGCGRRPGRSAGGRSRTPGTVCGNVVNASPAADGLPNLLALDAAVEVASADGTRVVPIADFVMGNRRTDLRAGELVTGLRVPKVADGARSAEAGSTGVARSTFLKLGSRAYLVISIVAVVGGPRGRPRRWSSTRGSRSGPARRSPGGCAASRRELRGRRAGAGPRGRAGDGAPVRAGADRRRPRVRRLPPGRGADAGPARGRRGRGVITGVAA